MGTFFRFSISGFTLIWLSLDSTQGFWGIEPLGKSEWTTGYSMQSSHEIAKNAILTTLPRLTKEWRVSFEVMPSEYEGGWENLLYMTTGGDRSPALWLHKRGWVYICSVIDGKKSNCKQLKIRPVVAGRWTKIEVSQVQVGANHIFSLTIGDQKVLSRTNSDPEELHDVIVYSARYPNLKGYLQKLKIDIKSPIEDPNEEPVNSRLGDCILSSKRAYIEKKKPSDHPSHPDQRMESLLRVQTRQLPAAKLRASATHDDRWQEWKHWGQNTSIVDPQDERSLPYNNFERESQRGAVV